MNNIYRLQPQAKKTLVVVGISYQTIRTAGKFHFPEKEDEEKSSPKISYIFSWTFFFAYRTFFPLHFFFSGRPLKFSPPPGDRVSSEIVFFSSLLPTPWPYRNNWFSFRMFSIDINLNLNQFQVVKKQRQRENQGQFHY